MNLGDTMAFVHSDENSIRQSFFGSEHELRNVSAEHTVVYVNAVKQSTEGNGV